MKICSAGAELLHAEEHAHKQAEEWTDGHDKANTQFSKFCKRS